MNDVARWLKNGAGAREGLRLLSQYAPNSNLEFLINRQPGAFTPLLIKTLEPFAEFDLEIKPTTIEALSIRTQNKFREEWPFLSEPHCPLELKILANDKITAYENTISLHRKLFSCSTPEECFETAKNLLKNFTQNRLITAEFVYYRDNGSIMGKHPIFQEMEKYKGYRKMSVVGLMEEKARLKGTIRRIEYEIGKRDKAHLLESRTDRLAVKHRQLEVVERMIRENDKPNK